MTTGYICDRCSATFTDGGKWLQGGYHGSTVIGHWWDLCPECMEGFAKWMANDEKELRFANYGHDYGQIADMSGKSADCVRDGDAMSDIHESAREHSLESESVREQSESVREQHYESQDITDSAGCVTDDGEMLHDTRENLESNIRRFYDEHECHSFMSVDFLDVVYGWLDRQAAITKRDTLHDNPTRSGSSTCAANRPISESADSETPETSENDASKCEIRDFDDTREELEEDVRRYMFPWRVDMALDWLDRQAAITEREFFETACQGCERLGGDGGPTLDELRDELRKYIVKTDRLGAVLDDLGAVLDDRDAQLVDAQEALDAVWSERDQWRDAYRDSERLRLELVKDLEHARRWNDTWRDLVHRYEGLCDGLLDERDAMRGDAS